MFLPHRRLRVSVALVLLATVGPLTAASPASSAQSPARPAKAVPKALATAFPVLRGPAVKNVPPSFERMATSPFGARLGINAALTRVVAVPGIADPWYLLPGRTGICFRNATSGGCMPTSQALAGNLFVQGIKPAPGSSPANSPLPRDHGLPETSTVTGIAPSGFDEVTATTKSGAPIVTRIGADGTYRLSGVDILSLKLTKRPLEITLRRP